MDLLKERILRDGKNLGNGILKVDGFINPVSYTHLTLPTINSV